MGTRSLIGLLNADGSVTHIYCHWDGYPSNNGQILIDHYTDYQKILALLKLGDLSSLGAEIGTKHDFDNAPKNECNSYSRDRGEKDTQARKSKSIEAYKADFTENWAEYCYLFDDGEWYVFWNGSGFIIDCSPKQRPDDFVTVRAVLAAEKTKEAI